MSKDDGLPSFFQFQGKTVADGLLEFELGGELEDDSYILEDEQLEEETLALDVTESDINGTLPNEESLDLDIEKYLTFKGESGLSENLSLKQAQNSDEKQSLQSKTNQGSGLLKFLRKEADCSSTNPGSQPITSYEQNYKDRTLYHDASERNIGTGTLNAKYSLEGVGHPTTQPRGAWARPPPFLPVHRPMPEPQPHIPSQQIPITSPADFLARLPHGKMMRPQDVSYVVRRVLDPMQSPDPFADDYYSVQFKIRKNNAIRDDFLKNQSSMAPPLLFIPLPTWKETKIRIRQQIESAKQVTLERSRKWEEREKVLGHNVKSDFSKPKEVLSVPTLSEIFNPDDENATENGGIARIPYSSRLWNMRQAVQRGYEALYTVQELQYLLDTPMVSDSSFNREEVLSDIDKAITALAQSLGIRAPVDEEKSGALNEITLEGGLVAAILQTAKGKRLLSRSFELLPPDYRWALLPAILARILQVNPNDQNDDDKLVEEKLMKNLLIFIQFAHQYQLELQNASGDNYSDEGQPSSRFSYMLLTNLRQCLKSVMVAFLDKVQLRMALLSSRSRAEVLHVIVQVGDRVSEYVDAIAANEWMQIRETFMQMLDT